MTYPWRAMSASGCVVWKAVIILAAGLSVMPAGAEENQPLPEHQETSVTGVLPEPPSGWSIKRIFDPFQNKTRCVVESAHQTIHDGYQETTVYIRVDDKSLVVMTDSNLDSRPADSGLQIDNHKNFRADRLHLEQAAVYEGGFGKILAEMRSGKILSLKLYFWPTWPSKGSRTVRFSTRGFERMYGRSPAC